MRGKISAGLAAAVLFLVALVVWHHAVARFAVASIVGLTTGYHVQIGHMRLGRDHGAFIDTHVTRGGEPVLDAQRIDLYYHLRDLLPGSKHRFGLVGITIDHPLLTIVHHEDGTYNVKPPGGAAAGTPGRPDTIPLAFYARIRDGEAVLIDQHRFYADARVQRIHHIDAAISVNTAQRTHYTVAGAFVGTKDEPFSASGAIDYRKGYAIHRVRAAAIPITTIGNYLIDSPAARILGGTARQFHATIYALGIEPNGPIAYHVMASAVVSHGRIFVRGLALPIDDISGKLRIFDGGLAAKRLDARIAGIPITVAGAIFNFSDPQFRLGLTGSGDLSQLRRALAFSATQPVRGRARVDALVEGPISDPLLLFGFRARRAYYQDLPLDGAHGVVALYRGAVAIVPLQARYSGIALTARGRLTLGDPVRSELAVNYAGASARVPYLGAVLADQELGGEALLAGSGTALGVRGYVESLARPHNLSGFFHIAADGSGSVGPVSLIASNGGRLEGAYAIDRPHDTSAFWVTATDVRVNQPQPVGFAGLMPPPLPSMRGTILDASVAGSGSAKTLTLGGRLVATGATIDGVPFENLSANFAGPLEDVGMGLVHADGPWGRFDGSGSFAPGSLIARGTYAGTLDELRPFTGDIRGHGAVSGPAAIAFDGNRVIVQAQGAQLQGATVSGVPVRSFSGTLAVENGVLRVYAARAAAAGGDVVAAGTYTAGSSHPPLALAAVHLDGAQLRGLGVPLQGGEVSAVGTVRPGGAVPAFRGAVVVRDGRSQGYAVAGTAQIGVAGDRLDVRDGVAALGGTYGIVNGSVGALSSGAPAYDLTANVPAGDIARAADTLRVPTFGTLGSFAADVLIGGHGTDPSVSGAVGVPVGEINGMGIAEAGAQVFADRGGLIASDGHVLVGSTLAAFSATALRGVRAFDVRARRATLSDFNDYFDTGDTLAGTGYLDLSYAQRASATYTSGKVDVAGFRYRQLPIGNTRAHWRSSRNLVRGGLSVGGTQGLLHASGSIALRPAADLPGLLRRSRYDLSATLQNLDLSTWLPALGFPTLPLTGRVDGDAHVQGAYPHLRVGGSATILGGTLGPVPLERASVRARAVGDRVDVTSLALSVPALDANGSGSFGLSAGAPIAFNVHARTTDVREVIAELTKRSVDVTGTYESSVQIGGTPRAPTFSAGLEASAASIDGVQIPSFVGSLALSGRDVLLRNAELQLGKGQVTLAGTLPLQLQPFAVGPSNAPIALDLFARGVDAAAFAPLLGNHTQLGGTLDGEVGVSGSVADPRVFGRMTLAGGRYSSDLERVPIAQTVATVTFEGTTASLDRFHASLGRGSLDASGRLGFDGAVPSGALAYAFSARARSAQLDFPAFGSGTLDADLKLVRRPPQLALLSGKAKVVDATIPFSAFLRASQSSGGGASAAGPPFNLAFDLGITAGRNVSVRSGGVAAGLDISGRGAVQLAGTLRHPTLAGRFDSTGGTLTYVDHAFKVQQGSVSFSPQDGVIPEIHAVGVTHVVNPDPNQARNPTGAADITIKVDGPLTSPSVAFSSNPPGYTRDEIVALLLPFGGFVGAVQFTDTGQILPPGQLNGAPVAPTGALLPGVFVRRDNGTLTIGQEAFNILNTQFTSGLLAPLENVLGSSLGLSDVNLTLDYSGNIGVNFRRILARDFYAVYATTLGVPIRQTFGFQYQPNEFTALQFSYFLQQGPQSLFVSPGRVFSTNARATAGQPIQGLSGFTFTFQRLF